MKNAKAIVGVLVIFVLGAVVGALTMRMIDEARIEALVSGDSKAREDAMVSRLSKRLNLDDQQRERVRIIIHDTRGELAAVHQQIQPQVLVVLTNRQSEIKKVLRPEQIAKYEKIIAEKKGR